MIRLLFLFLLAPAAVFSQNLIGQSKTQIRQAIENGWGTETSEPVKIADKDSLITFTFGSDSTVFELICGFDRSGKCSMEKISSAFEPCYEEQLKNVLGQELIGWKKINENQYISKFSEKKLLEIQLQNNNFAFAILRTDWNEEIYKMILGN